ncbi:MAG: AEC family transporter [Ruminococcus sp.]|nr:AEC family transporter [Ruminococcus sp.]
MSETILKQTIIMMVLMLVGFLCSKTGLISESSNKDLSKIVLQVVNPVVIFMSYQTEQKPELIRELMLTFALSCLSFVVLIAGAYLFIRKKPDRNTEIERFSSIYSNCGFMGIPLVNALFGMEGVFCLTAYITVFNLIVWTHGVILITGEKDMKAVIKVFYSPTVIAIIIGLLCFFLGIRLPEIPSKALGYITELNTPLAMIVSGATIAGTDLKTLVKKVGVYKVCSVKLILLPILLSVILCWLPVDEKVRMTVIVAASAPPAAMCTLLCIRSGKDSLYASEIFTAGTILSVITLPAVVKFTEYLTKTVSQFCG